MAQSIFSGANITVEIGDAGTTESTTFTEVPESAAFPVSGQTSTVIDVVTFNSIYNRKLLGTMAVGDIALTVNYIPDDTVHAQLSTAVQNQTRIQLKLSYFQNPLKTEGFYVCYNGYVSGDQLAGDKDSVVTREYTFSVDGAPVSTGIITADSE
jgi:hypothetical protein